MNKKKSFVIGALLLALPNILQNLVTNLAALVDNLMVGGLQEHAIAGVTIINQIIFIFTIVMFGIGGTAGIFIPQYKGVGDEKKITEIFKVSLLFSMAFGIAFYLVMLFAPEVVLRFFATDPYTIVEARSYLRFIQYTLLLLPISFAIGNAFRFCGYVKLPMYLAIMTVAMSIFLNFGLIHGNFGMPAMGVEGAALGTLIARIVELVIFIVLTIYIKSPVKLHVRTFFKLERAMFKTFMQTGYGLVLNEFFWAAGIQTLTIIYTMRISENIAAMSISATFSKLIWVGMGGMSVVFSIYLGEHLGRNDFDSAMDDAKRLKAISAFMGITLGAIVFILSLFLVGFFDVAPEIMRTGQILLLITVGFSWLNYLNASYYFTLRSGGDTKGVLIIDSLFTWLVMIPAAFIIGRFGLLLPIHFFFVQLFEFAKCFVAHRLYRKGEWLNNLIIENENA
jgi:putative MATE family efflux protein